MEEPPEETREDAQPEQPPQQEEQQELTKDQRQTLLVVYDNGGEVYNTFSMIWWVLHGLFIPVQLIVLSFTGTQLIKGQPIPPFVPFAGFFITVVWFRFGNRITDVIQGLGNYLGTAERRLKPIEPLFGGVVYWDYMLPLLRSIHSLFFWMMIGLQAIWLALIVFVVISLMHVVWTYPKAAPPNMYDRNNPYIIEMDMGVKPIPFGIPSGPGEERKKVPAAKKRQRR